MESNESLPPIASKHDDEPNFDQIDTQKLQTSKSFGHNNRPYSLSSTKSLLTRSKSKLIGSSHRDRNNKRAQTTSNRAQTAKYNRYNKMQQKPKYQNWGMKIDSTEALQEQIISLKKNFKKFLMKIH